MSLPRIYISLPAELIAALREEAKGAGCHISDVVHGYITAARQLYSQDERLNIVDKKLDNILDLLRTQGQESGQRSPSPQGTDITRPPAPSVSQWYGA